MVLRRQALCNQWGTPGPRETATRSPSHEDSGLPRTALKERWLVGRHLWAFEGAEPHSADLGSELPRKLSSAPCPTYYPPHGVLLCCLLQAKGVVVEQYLRHLAKEAPETVHTNRPRDRGCASRLNPSLLPKQRGCLSMLHYLELRER